MQLCSQVYEHFKMINIYILSYYNDAKTWNGFDYLTYQEGALARGGIIGESGEAAAALREIIDYYIPSALRAFLS